MTSDPHVVKILPSLILYNNCDNFTFDDVGMKSANVNQTRTPDLDEFCRRVLEKGEYPRLQVVERDRCLYTINNTRLALFQRLEQSGYCGKVRVEVVPLKTLPPGLRDVLCPQGHSTSRMSYWGKLCRGYKLLGQSANVLASSYTQTDNDDDDEDDDKYEDDDVDDIREAADRRDSSKSFESYRNQYEEALAESSSDDDDDGDDDDDDEEEEECSEESTYENGHMHQWDNTQDSESSGLIDRQGEDT